MSLERSQPCVPHRCEKDQVKSTMILLVQFCLTIYHKLKPVSTDHKIIDENALKGIELSFIIILYNKYMLFTSREVRIGKNCARRLGYRPRPWAEGSIQDRGHSFSQYGPT